MSAPIPPEKSPGSDAVIHSLAARPPSLGRRDRVVRPFRFLQASDFRLDTPCYGIAGLPASLRDRFVEARYVAARRVFDAAIEQHVDFVVLAGGLLDARLPGLRGPWFLAEQFRRLAGHGIDVYWAGASRETQGRWPAHVELPANVHCLTSDGSGVLHGRSGHPMARLLTMDPSSVGPKVERDNFTIAICPRCEAAPEQLQTGVDFWALGGLSDHETVQMAEVVAHFAGSPQGRSPSEVGRHGCSLVQVQDDGTVEIESIVTDVVRWRQQRVRVDSRATMHEIEAQLAHEQANLSTDSGVELSLVDWTLTGAGPAVQRLQLSRGNAEIIRLLNRDAAGRSPAVWTLGVDVELDLQRSARHLPQSTLTAFLQELDDLTPHLFEMFGRSNGPHPGRIVAGETRERLLQQVTCEGMHWLGEDEHELRPEV